MAESNDDPDHVNRLMLAMVAIVANLGSLLFGFDFGATSWLLISMDTYAALGDDDSTYTYFRYVVDSASLTGLIAAGAAIGATVTYLFLLFFGNEIPKRNEITLAACLFFIGGLLESSSGEASWGNMSGLAILMCGRLIYGAGIATSFHSVPQYISELVPPKLRGMIGSATEALVVTGVAVSFLCGYLFQSGYGWIVTYRIAYCLAFVMGICSLFLPHSPSWMVRNNMSIEEILISLRFVHPQATQASVTNLISKIQNEVHEKILFQSKLRKLLTANGSDPSHSLFKNFPPEVLLLMTDPRLGRCLAFAVTLVICQVGSGQGAILYYAGDIFDVLCPTDPYSCILGLGLVKLTAAYAMTIFADSLGRRVFLVGGTLFMIIGLVILCVGIELGDTVSSIIGIYSAVAGYEVGLGCMLWILLNELFPQYVRSAANSISIATLFAMTTIITFTLPYLDDLVGYFGVFLLFTSISVVAVVLLFLFAPETRGVDLEVAYKLLDVSCNGTAVMCCGEPLASDDGDDSDSRDSLDFDAVASAKSSSSFQSKQQSWSSSVPDDRFRRTDPVDGATEEEDEGDEGANHNFDSPAPRNTYTSLVQANNERQSLLANRNLLYSASPGVAAGINSRSSDIGNFIV